MKTDIGSFTSELSKENLVEEGDMKLIEIPKFCDLAMENHDLHQLDHKDITYVVPKKINNLGEVKKKSNDSRKVGI